MTDVTRALKAANLGLRFVLELVLFAALAYWGAHAGGPLWLRIGLGIAAPAAGIAAWALFFSPKARFRPRYSFWLSMQSVLFALGAAGLWAAGRPIWASVFAVVVAGHLILLAAWRQDGSVPA